MMDAIVLLLGEVPVLVAVAVAVEVSWWWRDLSLMMDGLGW